MVVLRKKWVEIMKFWTISFHKLNSVFLSINSRFFETKMCYGWTRTAFYLLLRQTGPFRRKATETARTRRWKRSANLHGIAWKLASISEIKQKLSKHRNRLWREVHFKLIWPSIRLLKTHLVQLVDRINVSLNEVIVDRAIAKMIDFGMVFDPKYVFVWKVRRSLFVV